MVAMYFIGLSLISLQLCLGVRVNHGNPQAFEGDIGLDPDTRAYVNGFLTPEQAFKGVFNNRYWTGAVVPYVFDGYFNQQRRQLMNQAFEQYNKHTCVRFVPRKSERNYVKMVNQNACWSIIGRGGGQQLLKMGGHCLQLGTAMHELMHAIGFYHEQSRNDRDQHVKIFWNNIQNGEKYNFDKYRTDYLGEAYDLNSIMHYRNDEFGSWGRNTIQSIKNPSLRLGNSKFSASDIRAINRMYKCDGTTGGVTPSVMPSCPDNNARCLEWANRGECKANPNYMLKVCKKSCNVCS